MAYHSGFAAIIGRPNVGKSTLLNKLVGRKVAIMSDKPQTTRNRILAVASGPDYQVVFIDTPGIHRAKHRLGEMMVTTAKRTLSEVDVVLFVVDATARLGEVDTEIAHHLAETGARAILVVNKLDAVSRDQLLVAVAGYAELYKFDDVVPISALTGANLEALMQVIRPHLTEGPQYYPEDTVSDQPEAQLLGELVREKILQLTRDEVPHSVAVVVEEMKERAGGLIYAKVNIFVERDSQRGILIGEGGGMLKEIGKLAREEAEALLGSRFYLDLWVKTKKDWRDRDDLLRQMGYRQED
ncbi:MAG: GTPase Era [Symbiobacteriia bacterium]